MIRILLLLLLISPAYAAEIDITPDSKEESVIVNNENLRKINNDVKDRIVIPSDSATGDRLYYDGTTWENIKVKTGWGYMEGDDSTDISETVTTGITCSDVPIVLVTFLGECASEPDSIDDFNTRVANSVQSASTEDITTTTFKIWIQSYNDTLDSGTYYGYSWYVTEP